MIRRARHQSSIIQKDSFLLAKLCYGKNYCVINGNNILFQFKNTKHTGLNMSYLSFQCDPFLHAKHFEKKCHKILRVTIHSFRLHFCRTNSYKFKNIFPSVVKMVFFVYLPKFSYPSEMKVIVRLRAIRSKETGASRAVSTSAMSRGSLDQSFEESNVSIFEEFFKLK